MAEKTLIAIAIMYTAVCVASVLKFGVAEKIDFKNICVSVFSPVLLLFLMIYFLIYAWKYDSRKLSFFSKVRFFIVSVIYEVKMLPLFHSMLIKLAIRISDKNFEEKSTVALLNQNAENISEIRRLHLEHFGNW